MELRWPTTSELPGYVDALERGWSPNTLDDRAGLVELEAIRLDPDASLTRIHTRV
jgi:hypothetical protein